MEDVQRTFTVFKYIPELDCFVVYETFAAVSERLGLVEWHPVVWLGRLFMRDNDFGEHWFDNWELPFYTLLGFKTAKMDHAIPRSCVGSFGPMF